MSPALDPKQARIMIVEDDQPSAKLLTKVLEKAGYSNFLVFTNPCLAIESFKETVPDLVLLDLHMRQLSGLEVMQEISCLLEPRKRPPVLILTGDTRITARYEALNAGAVDFLLKPLDWDEVLLRIQNKLETRLMFLQCQSYSHGLEELVSRRTKELQDQTSKLEIALADLQATQQQVIHQEGIRALGTMASGIAHDMNNSLTVILGYGDMLTQSTLLPPESLEKKCLTNMLRAAEDSTQMVRRLKEFYRPRTRDEDRQPIDLNELLEQTIEFTAPKWKSEAQARGVTIQMEKTTEELPFISGSASELREVLTNLVFNAVDAMPRGGAIKLQTQLMGEWVRLTVMDSGTGMTATVRKRCMEPFYTTKCDKGSGLGLSVSHGIIRRHGGKMLIESQMNKGTAFIIDLPICPEHLLPIREQAGHPSRSLHILVVDDQEGVRDIVSAYLAADRHTVETAATAAEALDKFCSGHFDLVITDRAMPQISGDELAANIKRVSPKEPIIMLTGFADLVNEAGRQNIDLVIGKPPRLEELRQAILDVLPEYDAG